jgi:hypothetical protein
MTSSTSPTKVRRSSSHSEPSSLSPPPAPYAARGRPAGLCGRPFHELDLCFGVCSNCATLYANPRLTRDSLRNLYDSEEFFEGRQENVI